MTSKELLNQLTLEEADQIAKLTMYLFGPEDIVCLAETTDDEVIITMISDMETKDEFMALINKGATPIPF